MDAQDAQDIQDGRLLQEGLTPATTTCEFQVGLFIHIRKRTLEFKGFTRSNTDGQDYKPPVTPGFSQQDSRGWSGWG